VGIGTSKNGSEFLARELRNSLGDTKIQLVNSDNSQTPKIRHFLENINTLDWKYLIFSPSIGSGVDITTPVDVTYLIDDTGVLSAEDGWQMLGRFRNCKKRVVYIKMSDTGNLLTDPQIILQKLIKAALETGRFSHFDENGLAVMEEPHYTFDNLMSKLMATRNRSCNNPINHMHTLAFLDHWHVSFIMDSADRALSRDIQKRRERAREERKFAVLEATPMPFKEYEEHREEGTLTEEHALQFEAGFLRTYLGFTFEDALPEEAYELFHREENRKRLDLFVKIMFTDAEQLRIWDRHEAQMPTSHREHHFGHAASIYLFMKKLWPTYTDMERAYTQREMAEILLRIAPTSYRTEPTYADASAYMTWLPETAFTQKTAYKQISHILKIAGVKMERVQAKISGIKTYKYELDRVTYNDWFYWGWLRYLAELQRAKGVIKHDYPKLGMPRFSDKLLPALAWRFIKTMPVKPTTVRMASQLRALAYDHILGKYAEENPALLMGLDREIHMEKLNIVTPDEKTLFAILEYIKHKSG
jgi:hypothetical protein